MEELNEACQENWLSSFMRRCWWLFLFGSGGFIFLLVGCWAGIRFMQLDAIKHDAAIFNAKNGQWEWIAQVPTVPEEQLKEIDSSCKKLGSKSKNDPKCLLMGR